MAKYINKFDTLEDYNAALANLDYPSINYIADKDSLIWNKESIYDACYEVISEPISSHTSTDYSSVYSFSDLKWYMKNNLNNYEEYGVYDIVEDISSATTYEGKLAVVGTTEYQYIDDEWVEVGTYESTEETFVIDDTYPSPYIGQELPTTFKIPASDIESVGYLDMIIRCEGGVHLSITENRYHYIGDDDINGSVTNDGTYYYYSLPNIESVVIESILNDMGTFHLIAAGSMEATVEYDEKETPSYSIFNSYEEMEAEGCPNVGINEYGLVGNNLFKYSAIEGWYGVEYDDPKMIAFYENEDPLIVYENGNGELTQNETRKSGTSPVSVYIGNGVTSIGGYAFDGCNSLSSVTIPNSVTSIGDFAFHSCSSLSSVTIPDSVTSIGGYAFYDCNSLTSITIPSGVTSIATCMFYECTSLTSITIPSSVTNIYTRAFSSCRSLQSVTIGSGVTNIAVASFYGCSGLSSVTIPSGVTSIDVQAFAHCSSLQSVTIEATTPPTLGNNVFNYTNNCPIYVPCESVDAYKAANNWSSYASRIQAIPNSCTGGSWVTYQAGTVLNGNFGGVRISENTYIPEDDGNLTLTTSDGRYYIESMCDGTDCLEYDDETGECIEEECIGYDTYITEYDSQGDQIGEPYTIVFEDGYWTYDQSVSINQTLNFDVDVYVE